MATEWFCRIMEDQWGPMSAEELTLVARRGRLTRDDLVRRGEKGTWVRAEIVAGLFNAEAPLQPAATRRLAVTSDPSPSGRGQVSAGDSLRRGEGALDSVDHHSAPTIRAAIAVKPIPAKRSTAVSPTIQSKRHPAQRPSPPTPTQYWISDGHRTAGPFTSAQIRYLAATGQLQRNHLIRNQRSPWLLASRVKGLTFTQPMSPIAVSGAHLQSVAVGRAEFVAVR